MDDFLMQCLIEKVGIIADKLASILDDQRDQTMEIRKFRQLMNNFHKCQNGDSPWYVEHFDD